MASWDIFCNVVDNYGDIGVTWRLARQLAAEYGHRVRLWVDEPAAFVALCPQADAGLARQQVAGVEVCHWAKDWQPQPQPDVVIEAFGCTLPEAQVAAMRAAGKRPLWLNLEYLSAEDWVAGCHGLPSPQGQGLQKYFFFPGFVAGTGGVLREGDLLARRRAFQADEAARQAFLAGLGVTVQGAERLISLFAYENPGLGEWLDALAADPQATRLLVPRGRILGDLRRWLGEANELQPGFVARRGNLQVQVLPFVSQDDYDRLLWCCDFNAVRGEDSFMRAQWAGRPLLWHIYQQQEDAHWEKLEAFLALYLQGLSPSAALAVRQLWQAWNAGAGMGAAWQTLQPHWAEWRAHAELWCAEQASRPDLAAALEQFYLSSL
ncbi:elongation factor P maturation arginine rhamnosyltransferase EarP [Pseudomonas sp. GCM10022188]|uniref:elongation factor P maturation arginine rhamnosyltransferase EarP n=1 Tax=Pseudomonas TaxID=286 RepID=UPI001E41AEA9|nr:elongation factor P maturation arginine rhamnosyltransferase EarP [Pseudomonas oryzagri]MCC6074026.1 elongation factor P maturation arginine rhamnosyltransferase EarP [Pseudomonas oryzagri]